MRRLVQFLGHEYRVARGVAHRLEFDSRAQWVYHRKMCWFWLANLPLVTALLIGVLFASPRLALVLTAVMLGVNTYYSLYANFDTEFDAVSASYAAIRADDAARASGSATVDLADVADQLLVLAAMRPGANADALAEELRAQLRA